MDEDELFAVAKEHRAPYDLIAWVAKNGKLPVVNFSAGGIATPADAALMMQLGADGVFVGSGIFKSADPAARAKAIVQATTHYQDAKILAEVSQGLGDAMPGLEIGQIEPGEAHPAPRLVAWPAAPARPQRPARPAPPPAEGQPHIGVLALQGAFREHVRMLRGLGAKVTEVRLPRDLEGLDGLMIPGGESTTIGLLLEEHKLMEPLREFVRTHPVFGTCAGLIMLAKHTTDGEQPLLQVMDITVRRNAFGRQPRSFEGPVELTPRTRRRAPRRRTTSTASSSARRGWRRSARVWRSSPGTATTSSVCGRAR